MEKAQYSLRQIVDMTGISEFTLRGWELRYKAFEPDRTSTGRRRYSSQDLQKALLLRELVKRDHRIGDIAGLKISALKKLMGSDGDLADGSNEQNGQGPSAAVREVIRRAALQEWDDLENNISKNVRSMKPLAALRHFIIPLFQQMGLEVAQGRFGIAQEHILSSMLKQQLHLLSQSKERSSKAHFLMATPEGDFHDLGILSAHAIARQLKVRSLFLGPNTPKKEICETALRLGATHVLLAATVTKKEGAKEDFYSFVNFLDQNLPAEIQFWLAGRAAGEIHLKREVVQLSSLSEFEERLLSVSQERKKNA